MSDKKHTVTVAAMKSKYWSTHYSLESELELKYFLLAPNLLYAYGSGHWQQENSCWELIAAERSFSAKGWWMVVFRVILLKNLLKSSLSLLPSQFRSKNWLSVISLCIWLFWLNVGCDTFKLMLDSVRARFQAFACPHPQWLCSIIGICAVNMSLGRTVTRSADLYMILY